MAGAGSLEGGEGAPPLDQIVYRSPVAKVAAFRCPTWHPRFRDSGPVENHVFVFPRRRVVLCHDGGRPFLADSTVVTLYNRGQVYYRGPVGTDGDECEWFAVQDALLVDAIGHFDPSVDDRRHRPFRHAYAPCGATAYFIQRTLFDRLRLGTPVDSLWVDETVVGLLSTVLSAAYGFWGPSREHGAASRRQEDFVAQVRKHLSENLESPLSLAEIAHQSGLSAFHLCRVFRGATGSTLHAYRNQVRLRSALERLAEGDDLTTLALDLGYSSHSHFSHAFRRAFGVAPSAARRRLSGRRR